MYLFKEGWKETTFFPPDIARNSGEKEVEIKNIMKCHICKKEFINLKEDVWINKDKLRCKNCDFLLNKENVDEYLRKTNAEN